MKALELRELSKGELEKLLKDKQAELVKVRFGVAGKQERNYKKIGQLKKIIARIKTILNRVK